MRGEILEQVVNHRLGQPVGIEESDVPLAVPQPAPGNRAFVERIEVHRHGFERGVTPAHPQEIVELLADRAFERAEAADGDAQAGHRATALRRRSLPTV